MDLLLPGDVGLVTVRFSYPGNCFTDSFHYIARSLELIRLLPEFLSIVASLFTSRSAETIW
jgi:hypothetical protein